MDYCNIPSKSLTSNDESNIFHGISNIKYELFYRVCVMWLQKITFTTYTSQSLNYGFMHLRLWNCFLSVEDACTGSTNKPKNERM